MRRLHVAAKATSLQSYQAELGDSEHAALKTLAHLAASGWQLGEDLWSVNTSGCPFVDFTAISTPFDEADDEILWAKYGAFDFFASLPAEDKNFVAAATARSVLGYPDMETDVAEGDAEGWQEHHTQAYERIVGQSGLLAHMTHTLLRLLELAAPAIVEDYERKAEAFLAGNRKKADSEPVSRQDSVVIRAALDELRSELLQDFDNLGDSMKATQMQVLRTIEKGGQPVDPDPSLIQALGSEMFSQLHADTKEHLREAERLRSANSANAGRSEAMYLGLAYELEFYVRVTQKLAMIFILKYHCSEYPPESEFQLVREKKANKRITPAQVLNIVKEDKEVQEQLFKLSINWNQLLLTGRPATALRNKAMHPAEAFDVADVQRIRELMLDGEKGALRALMPWSPNKPAQAP